MIFTSTCSSGENIRFPIRKSGFKSHIGVFVVGLPEVIPSNRLTKTFWRKLGTKIIHGVVSHLDRGCECSICWSRRIMRSFQKLSANYYCSINCNLALLVQKKDKRTRHLNKQTYSGMSDQPLKFCILEKYIILLCVVTFQEWSWLSTTSYF